MTHPTIKAFGDNLRAEIVAGRQLPGQANAKPAFWIEVTKGGAGYFACMFWDGEGYAEPWETGMGRYVDPSEAEVEGRRWAEDEGIEFRASDPA